MIKFIRNFITVLVFGFLLTSCTFEEPTSYVSDMIVKQPKVIAYSGDHMWGNDTRSNAGNGDLGSSTWINKGANDLTNITDEERDGVLKAIEEKVTGERISEDVVFPWTDYFLQDVVSAQSNYGGAGNSGNPSASYTFEAWNTGSDCSPWYHHGNDYENYDEVSNSAHLNNFFQKQNPDGSQERINETTLMTNMQCGTYEEMKGKQFRWYINCHENLHWYEYIVVEVDGSYYICFDFACGHKENDVDGNPGRGNTQNDWDYNDWILKITPAGEQPDIWTGDNNEPEEQPKDEPKDDIEKTDHVEINLSLEEHNDYLSSHLSIHVRSNTDVEVFIPVPMEYYCDVDDMAIVNKHVEEYMIHGGPTSVEYDINGNIVTLNVEFLSNGIRVWTEGINENVLTYCEENFKDGLTFEVWNYFNESVTPYILKDYLNDSWVKFQHNPSKYINAFVIECGDDSVDYHVKPKDKESYPEHSKDYWYNGSDKNEIYDRK